MSRHSISDPAQRTALTDRQEDVIRLVSRGLTNGEIAERLGVTLDGVKWHMREILGKFGVNSREEAVECWKQQRGGRAKSWLRAFTAGFSLRFAAGAVTAASGVAAVGAIVYSLGTDDQPTTPKANVAQAQQSMPLTLDITGAQSDGAELQLGLWLHGQPELGRILAPDPSSVAISDELGNSYAVRSVARDPVNTRGLTVTADPPLTSAMTLHVTLRDPSFLSTDDEMALPGRTVPSVTLNDQWDVEVPGLVRVSSSFAAVDHSPQAFGPVTAVLESARQDASATVVTLRVVDMPEDLQLSYTPDVQLTDSNGRFAAPTHGSWGDGPNHDRMEFVFAKTTGPVTLTVRGVPRELFSESEIPGMVASGSTNRTEAELKTLAGKMTLAKQQLIVLFAQHESPTWTFTLP